MYPLPNAQYLRDKLAKVMICAINILIAKKAGDLKKRSCDNYCIINNGTIRDVYPLPNAQYLRDKLAKVMIYIKLNQRNAFNLIRIKRRHK